ncbi:PIN domain-containing protein [Achromobacter xylosoxidans]
MALQTKFVYVDTQSFVKANLDFESRTIKAFAQACAEDDLEHLMTTITVREVKKKIEGNIDEGLNSILQFRRKAKILEISTDEVVKGFFAQFDKAAVHAGAQKAFEDFLDDSKTTTVDLKAVDAEQVFDMYFNRRAPFGDGKKKSEFPDAFSLLAVRAHIDKQEVYVVSQDEDLIRFCNENEGFIHVDVLEKVLDILNSHESERAKFIKDYFTGHDAEIKERIKEKVNGAEVYNVSTWEDAEVIDHEVVEVGEFDPNIVAIDDESCEVSFDVDVKYRVKVSGPDTASAIWDKEAGHMYTFDEITREEVKKMNFGVEISLFFEVLDGKFEMGDVDIDIKGIHRGIEVSVEEYPDWDGR